MSKQTLSAVLTFCLLAGGTAAIGSEMFSQHSAPAPQATMATVTLPTVNITGHRDVPMASVALPTVTVTGHREVQMSMVTLPTVTVTGRRQMPTSVVAEASSAAQPRVE